MADATTTETTNSIETQPLSPEATAEPSSSTTLLTETTDASAEGDTTDTTKTDDEPEANPLFGAPEGDAEYALTLPEGVTLDKAALDAVVPLFKELNLSNEGASKLASAYAENVLPGVVAQVMDGVNADVAAQQTEWANAAKQAVLGGKDADGNAVDADAAFGGKTLKEVQQVAAKALDRFGGTELREFMEATGMGNHPAMLKFAYQAGAAISEDQSFERGGGTPNTPKTREEKYYGSKTA